GDDNYNAATVVTQNVTALKADQVITVGTPAPGIAVYGTDFDVAATSDSGLAVSITASGAGAGSGSGGATVSMASGTGSATITFSQDGDDNYNAATPVTQDVTALKAALTVTVDADPTTVTQDPFSRAYGQDNPAFSVREVGFVGGDGA